MTTTRGRPRRAGANEEILKVALELLREKGYRDLNVDEVAQRAGVAKTTIYRRWPTKGAVVAAAIEMLAPRTDGDVETVLRETKELLGLIAGVDDVEVLRVLLAPQRERLRELTGSGDEADALLGALVIGALLS